MSLDCCPMETDTPQRAPSKPLADESYPIPRMVSRTICGISTYASVVTSPATCTKPVVAMVSTATRDSGSAARSASRMASLIWSQILSGCPSVTDSEVKSRSLDGVPWDSWCSGKVTRLPYSVGGGRLPPYVPMLRMDQPGNEPRRRLRGRAYSA
ncbi:hypothetical protein AHiyo1_34380 [Arthrobacter sp. Hiyo1]|nr:hypothetical protein AHiyo1_34380 [Arthrobacter sp. Hiyo1]